MQYVEYGAHNSQTVILLHGGGLSWWNYREVAQMIGNFASCSTAIHYFLDKHFDMPYNSFQYHRKRRTSSNYGRR